MAAKDFTEKTLEAYNDVFADIINVLLFKGKLLVGENELSEAVPRSIYKADGRLHELERDVAKYWRKGLFQIAFFGLENQTDINKDMPLRLFGYDGTAYRSQILTDKEYLKKLGHKAKRFPVITLVLYLGYKKRWQAPTTLYECLKIPAELKPYVNDYKMNLFEIAYLSDEQVQLFQSDFRIVADYFVQMRKNRNYVAPETTIKHVHEPLQLMSIMTKDYRFEEVYHPNMERKDTNMCEVLDRIENRGIEKGTVIGFRKGTKQGEDTAFSLVRLLMESNRLDDLKKASEDSCYREKLIQELFPKNQDPN